MTSPEWGSAVNLGSCIGGIPVTVHYSFFLLLLIEFANSIRYTSYPMFMLFVVVLYGPVLFVTILVHEFGHALTTKKLGGSVSGITLWPLGGFAVCGPTHALAGDLKVALAGPLMHIPMMAVWWGIYLASRGEGTSVWPSWVIYLDVLSSGAAGFFQILSSEAFYMNFILLCFNLFIPAYPLDGGRIYAAALILYLHLKPLTSAKITAVTALLLSSGMMLYAIFGFLNGTGGSGLLLGLVGAFVFYNSLELYRAVGRGELGDHPIFGRECYKEESRGGGCRSGRGSGSGAGAGRTLGGAGAAEEDEEVPAQTDAAVMT